MFPERWNFVDLGKPHSEGAGNESSLLTQMSTVPSPTTNAVDMVP